ncbi:DNA double-strand break repair nuclease NurA [Meiothermus sp.]|uniref:DNA double-strand break repair nuclease NurA n=1 Tax=Meiothermus sp. TaxID=1955249 RepID=UPI00307F73CD
MSHKEIPDAAIEQVAKHINSRSNKNYGIPVVGNDSNVETPQVFEIIPFDQIDNSERRFYAVDGSYNSEQFYNGLSIGIYAAGYVCFKEGKQIRVNQLDDPVILGKAYYPENILVAAPNDLLSIYDELLDLEPVKKLLSFWNVLDDPSKAFAYSRETICTNLSTLLSFCQEVLELALVFEIASLEDTKPGDFILRDGTLRPIQIKQEYSVQIGKYVSSKNIRILAITKQSPIKMELSYTFKQIDTYLQDQLKPNYQFSAKDPKRQKLCCWFEVPEVVLESAYRGGGMFIKKDIRGGRGFGLFLVARLDYVEKLQNYDWVVIDMNIFDAIPGIEQKELARNRAMLESTTRELTRLTQEHYILGYPYPLAEAHNFISLKRNFKEQLISRLKYSLYKDQRMDHVEIENLFLDMHDRF